MPLKVSHGIKSWIDDFQQSKDKRFDGKSAEKRREMAIAAYMASKREQKENVKTADKKPEMYTKPDGKRGTRMVPVDREVVKQEKNLEWLKAALEAQARKTKPCDEDVEETAEALAKESSDDDEDDRPHTHALVDKKGNAHGFAPYKMYDGHHHIVTNRTGMRVATSDDHAFAKKMAKNRGGSVITTKSVKLKKPMDPKHADKMIGKSIKGHYHESVDEAIDMSKVGTKATIMHPVTRVSKKVDKKDVQKHVDSGWLHMGPKKNRITKSRKEATIPDGQTAMTKKPEISKKDKETVGKIQALMKRANEAIKHTHAAVDKKGLAIGFASHERDAKDMARRHNGKVVKLKKPMSHKKTDMMINRPFNEDVNEISIDKLSRYGKAAAKDVQRQRDKVKGALDQPLSTKHQKAGMAAMKKLTKRSKGSDMYVDKMTGRSKVKPSAATVGKDKHVSVENYAQKSADRHKMLMKQARSDMKNAKSHSDMIKHMNKYQAANKAYDRATRGQFDEISNAKMGQYVRKAADDAARKASKGDVVGARQRVKGVNKAMDKIDHNRLFGRSG